MLQVITLLVLSVLYVLYLRFIRPNSERFELGVAIVGGLMDVGTYTCGVILLSKQDASNEFTCGPAPLHFSFE